MPTDQRIQIHSSNDSCSTVGWFVFNNRWFVPKFEWCVFIDQMFTVEIVRDHWSDDSFPHIRWFVITDQMFCIQRSDDSWSQIMIHVHRSDGSCSQIRWFVFTDQMIRVHRSDGSWSQIIWFMFTEQMIHVHRSDDSWSQIRWFLFTDQIVHDHRSDGSWSQIIWFMFTDQMIRDHRSEDPCPIVHVEQVIFLSDVVVTFDVWNYAGHRLACASCTDIQCFPDNAASVLWSHLGTVCSIIIQSLIFWTRSWGLAFKINASWIRVFRQDASKNKNDKHLRPNSPVSILKLKISCKIISVERDFKRNFRIAWCSWTRVYKSMQLN